MKVLSNVQIIATNGIKFCWKTQAFKKQCYSEQREDSLLIFVKMRFIFGKEEQLFIESNSIKEF